MWDIRTKHHKYSHLSKGCFYVTIDCTIQLQECFGNMYDYCLRKRYHTFRSGSYWPVKLQFKSILHDVGPQSYKSQPKKSVKIIL